MSETQQTTEEIFARSQNWCRLTVCLNNPVKEALLSILHNTKNLPNVNGLPSDPIQLFNYMNKHQNKLKKNKVLKSDQLDQLLPKEGKVSSDELDLTLIRFLIRTFSNIKNEDGHWGEPRDNDQSIFAAVVRAVNIRNKVFHYPKPTSMSDQEFNDIWFQIESILSALFYQDDISDYKEQTFDPILFKQFHSNMAEDFENILLAYKEKQENEVELKDFVQRKYRDMDANKIVTDIDELFNSHEMVMVTADTGLGKTFSAKHLKYLWSSNKILRSNKLLYIDSKKVNKTTYKASNAAPILLSELGDMLKHEKDEYLESFECVKTAIQDLIIIIDGVDELSIEEDISFNFLKELQLKIDRNDEISAMETIIGIYFGFFFPGSKIIVFGRKNEVGILAYIQNQSYRSPLFNIRTCVVLELQPLDDEGAKEFISRATCNKSSCGCEKCTETYSLVRDIEFLKNPSHLVALIKTLKCLSNAGIGRITKTKIFIITIFNLLIKHMPVDNSNDVKTFETLLTYDKANTFRECIQTIAKMSFLSLLDGRITIKVERYNENDVEYFKYKETVQGKTYCIIIKRDTLEQLDFFFVRYFEYHVILEPRHLTYMEFLGSCYIYCYPDEWHLLLKVNKDRQTNILPFVAGLHSNENFTKDFVREILHDDSNREIEHYLTWLFSVEMVRLYLPSSSWYGLKENGTLFPSFDLLYRVNEEVDVSDRISKKFEEVKDLVCYCNSDFEWYEMKNFKHFLLTNDRNEYNIKSFLHSFKKYKIKIKGTIEITSSEQFNTLVEMFNNDQLKIEIT